MLLKHNACMENRKFVQPKNLNFGSILLGMNLIRLERRITNMFWTFYNPMTKNGLVWNIFQKVTQMEVWNGSRILDFICNFSKWIDTSIFNFQLENTKFIASYLILNSLCMLIIFCIFPLLWALIWGYCSLLKFLSIFNYLWTFFPHLVCLIETVAYSRV